MKIDASKAVGGYAAVMTLAAMWFGLTSQAAPETPTRLGVIDVERINVRERDGTLRMIIAGRDRIGGIIVAGTEYPHPNRQEAGMIFFNDEGTENGGLVFSGRMENGRPTNAGHLSFDRWHQDQTLYLDTEEDGPRRRAGIFVQDRPDIPMDFARLAEIRAMPEGPERSAALARAGVGSSPARAFLGRDYDNASKLVLRDGQGRPRLQFTVTAEGAAAVEFLDAQGRVTRTVRPEG